MNCIKPIVIKNNLVPIKIIGSRGPAGLVVTNGSKYSAIDEGQLNNISIDDDFIYICVQSGTAGNAKWKRAPLQLI